MRIVSLSLSQVLIVSLPGLSSVVSQDRKREEEAKGRLGKNTLTLLPEAAKSCFASFLSVTLYLPFIG